MCSFCLLFDFSTAMAKVQHGEASIVKAPEGLPFLPKQQFAYCPVCGAPRDPELYKPGASFRTNLRRVRRARGITQETLAKNLGLHRAAVCKWEKGRSMPSVAQFATLCRLLDVNPQELL